jgi:hypothetical protein
LTPLACTKQVGFWDGANWQPKADPTSDETPFVLMAPTRTQPSAPGPGFLKLWPDITNNVWYGINSSSVVSHLVDTSACTGGTPVVGNINADGSVTCVAGGSGVPVGGANAIQVYGSSTTFLGDSGDTLDTSGSNGMQLRYGIKTGGAGTASGGWNPAGLTSGSAGLGVNDVAGTPDILLLPTGVPTLNQVLTVTALGVTCPTDPFWTGRTCDQLGFGASTGTVTITDDIFLGTAVYNNALGQAYAGTWDFDSTATAPTLSSTGGTQGAGSFWMSNSGTPTLYHRRILPSTWTSAGGVDLHLYWVDECCGSGNVKWTAALGCAAAGSGAYMLVGGGAPLTFNAASSVTSASGAVGVMPVKSDITGLTLTNCAANSQLAVKLYRDNAVGSNVGGVVKLLYAVLTIRRTNQ